MRKLKAGTVWKLYMKLEQDKQREMDRLSAATKNVRTDYRDKIQALRARCPHENETYYRDAAGGFGGFHRCNDCGQEAKRSFKEFAANVK